MRTMTAIKFLCILAAAAVVAPASVSALPLVDVEGAVGGWQASPSGNLAYEGTDNLGTDLDLEDDLGYDDETDFTARLKIGMPLVIPNIYLMATPLEYEERSTRTEKFEFGDKEFEAKEEFRSRLTLDHYDIGLFYNIPLLRGFTLNTLSVEAGLNARIIDAEAVIEQEVSGTTRYEKKSGTIPVPMVYLGLGLQPLDRLGLEAEVRGISYSDYEILSLIGRLKVDAVGPVFVSGGYRYDAYDVEDDDLEIDLDFSGPFLETGVDF
ncbi:MAG: TIGR04219 family outer membrane beta-barrel protein [Desulfobacterales bacterium]